MVEPMKRFTMFLAAVGLTVAAGNAWAGGNGGGAAIYGTWSNPKGTIDVRTAPCGERLCGEIVRASPKAIDDARKKGVNQLVGLQLLQDYKRRSDDWAGRVYVPDMGRTFSSRIAFVGPDQIRISGCLIGGILCKSQVWHRV